MKTMRSIVVIAVLGCATPALAQPRDADWKRVSLAEKDDVWITLDGQPMVKRMVLTADAATVTVLNDTMPGLDARATRDLRDIARRSPAGLLLTLGPGMVRLDDLRISAAGVYLRDAKLAELSSLIEVHPRDRVVEIRLVQWSRPRRFSRHLFGWPGLVGLSAATMATAGLCEQMTTSCSNRSYALAGAAGAVGFSIATRHFDRQIADGVVYRRHP
jgi:hypothetical protein